MHVLDLPLEIHVDTHLGGHKVDFVLQLTDYYVLLSSSPGRPHKHHPVTLVLIGEVQLLLEPVVIEQLVNMQWFI